MEVRTLSMVDFTKVVVNSLVIETDYLPTHVLEQIGRAEIITSHFHSQVGVL